MRQILSMSLVTASVVACANVSVRAADGVDLLPADTQAVLTVNVKQLLSYPAIKNEIPKIRQGIRDQPAAEFLISAFGVDPLTDIEQVIVGATDVNDDDDVLILLRGRFDPTKIHAAAKKTAKERKDYFKIVPAGSTAYFEAWLPEQEHPLYLAVFDTRTAVASLKKKKVTDALEVHAGKKKPAINKDLASLLKKPNPSHVCSVAMLGKAFANSGPYGDKVEHATGGISVTTQFNLDFAITTKDAASAIAIADEMRKGIDAGVKLMAAFAENPDEKSAVSQILERLKVNSQGNSVTIHAGINMETFQKLIARDRDE
jgi:hypothetical protein